MFSANCSVSLRIYILAATVDFNFFPIQAFLFLLQLKMLLKAVPEGCLGRAPCIPCHAKKKGISYISFGAVAMLSLRLTTAFRNVTFRQRKNGLNQF